LRINYATFAGSLLESREERSKISGTGDSTMPLRQNPPSFNSMILQQHLWKVSSCSAYEIRALRPDTSHREKHTRHFECLVDSNLSLAL